MLYERQSGEKGENVCGFTLGPKGQGAFLQFQLSYGKCNEVIRQEAEERVAWQPAGSSRSLAPSGTRPSLLPCVRGKDIRKTESGEASTKGPETELPSLLYTLFISNVLPSL